MSARNLCYTLNNFTEDERTALQGLKRSYHVMGEEVGEEGTRHIQGYIEFENSKRLTSLKKINARVHWEKRRGTAAQAADYCKKDGIVWEEGVISRQGERRDLEEFANAVIKSEDLQALVEDYPRHMLVYGRHAALLLSMKVPPRAVAPIVIWLWGAAGVGKTRRAYDLFPAENVYKKNNSKWWDGYTGQPVVLIDDFDRTKWDFREVLLLLDRYPHRVEFKGGSVQFNRPTIYITCEFHPDSVYGNTKNEIAQLSRRILHIEEVVAEVVGNTMPPQEKNIIDSE